jgi:hypothetical protein
VVPYAEPVVVVPAAGAGAGAPAAG